jgi:DNA-directed RNA polymerase specialized sigma24 family protein
MPDLSESVQNRIDHDRVDLPEDIRRIAELRDVGRSYAEIAEELGISERAVEGRLRRYRTNYRKKS